MRCAHGHMDSNRKILGVFGLISFSDLCVKYTETNFIADDKNQCNCVSSEFITHARTHTVGFGLFRRVSV